MGLQSFIKALVLKPSFFDHPSELHGISHTYRVMALGMTLARRTGHSQLTRPLLAAAFVHDMARKHDGYCTQHGLWAAETKLPEFTSFFVRHGISQNSLLHIHKAVVQHSIPEELDAGEPAYILTALLKDADALDRIRLGDRNLDPRYLRFTKSHALIKEAIYLYASTQNLKFVNFATVLDYASFTNQM